MAVSSDGSRPRRLTAFLGRNDRFLTPRMLASIGDVPARGRQLPPGARITDDGVIYYDFMRRLVGEDVQAYAYQFGVVFWNLPFYVLSRIVRIANDDDWIEHALIGAVGVAVASTAAVVAIFYVSWRLIRELGLPGGPGAILLTVFGSPLFYYGIFQTGSEACVRRAARHGAGAAPAPRDAAARRRPAWLFSSGSCSRSRSPSATRTSCCSSA